jgi:hypothetical protein
MTNWLDALPGNPLPTLLETSDTALRYWAGRDLLGEEVGPVSDLWTLPAVTRILRRQEADGGWRYPNRQKMDADPRKYGLVETFRQLGVLVGVYGLNREHEALSRTADYLFRYQTADGDIRGILDNQTMPYYHGMILAYLIEAGYVDDARVKRGLDWLLATRQADGGWVIAAQTVPTKEKTTAFWQGPPLTADPQASSSHLATGMALRPFAVHPAYRGIAQESTGHLEPGADSVLGATAWLKERFFRADAYYDRRGAAYWTKFKYPFWWSDLSTGLDSLARLGYSRFDADVLRGLAWFIENQEADGLWPTGYGTQIRQDAALRRWIGLAVCRVVKKLAAG